MPLTDPYKIRLGDDLLAYLDTLPDAPEYVRAAIRWARALDLTESTVASLLEARDAVRRVGDVYRDPVRALDQIVSDTAITILDHLRDLESLGWTKPYLCAAADILNGTWLTPFFGASGVQAEILEAEQMPEVDDLSGESVAQSYAAKHGGDAARLRELVLALTDASARALRVVVTEFWRGHKLVEARLGYASDD